MQDILQYVQICLVVSRSQYKKVKQMWVGDNFSDRNSSTVPTLIDDKEDKDDNISDIEKVEKEESG